jgi:type IV pilus assembly protein PilX
VNEFPVSRPGARAPRAARARARRPAGARGFSLIIAMLMLAVIGLASAAIMRNATSGDQVATNNRLQTQASQYAQLALRFCEMQLARTPAERGVTLFDPATPPAWTAQRNWAPGGARSAHTLSSADAGSSVQPRVAPQCMMEGTALPHVYTVTARGFSPDFRADASTGATRSGSVVWLQATVYADDAGAVPGVDPAAQGDGAAATACAGGCALRVRQRLWQQLLTPPF